LNDNKTILLNIEWLKAIRIMIFDLKQLMESDKGESYDEEYYIHNLSNILMNIDDKLKELV
jgi:hypothetical protein